MNRLALIVALLFLAACGIDGSPNPVGGASAPGGPAGIGVVGDL